MEFSRQKHWRRLPSPSPGDLPDPGIKPGSSALQADSWLSHQGSRITGSYLNYRIALTPLLPVGSGGTSGKEPDCPCRWRKRCRFDLWVGKIPWRRAWQPTPVFLPGEFHGQRSLVGCSPRGFKELDLTERLNTPPHTHTQSYIFGCVPFNNSPEMSCRSLFLS